MQATHPTTNMMNIRPEPVCIDIRFSWRRSTFYKDELQWEECHHHERSFNLYFGILKLSHIYTMTMDVTFHHEPVQLEPIVDHRIIDGYQLSVTEISKVSAMNRTSFEVELVINPDAIPGPFRRTFLLRERSMPEQEPIKVKVTGKILRHSNIKRWCTYEIGHSGEKRR